MKLTVRKATNDDLSQLLNFALAEAIQTENLHLDPDIVKSGISAVLESGDRKGFFLVAEANHKLLGCLRVTYDWAIWRNGEFWWLRSVYVPIEFRRLGIFSTLYSELRKFAEAKGNVLGVRLYVMKDNPTAQAAYQKAGLSDSGYSLFQQYFKEFNAVHYEDQP